MSYKR